MKTQAVGRHPIRGQFSDPRPLRQPPEKGKNKLNALSDSCCDGKEMLLARIVSFRHYLSTAYLALIFNFI